MRDNSPLSKTDVMKCEKPLLDSSVDNLSTLTEMRNWEHWSVCVKHRDINACFGANYADFAGYSSHIPSF